MRRVCQLSERMQRIRKVHRSLYFQLCAIQGGGQCVIFTAALCVRHTATTLVQHIVAKSKRRCGHRHTLSLAAGSGVAWLAAAISGSPCCTLVAPGPDVAPGAPAGRAACVAHRNTAIYRGQGTSKGCTVRLARFTNNIARTLLHFAGSFGALALAAMLQRLLKCIFEVVCLAARRSPQHNVAHRASLYALLLPQYAN
jgi:hypothetical protein